ncbi:MAG: hypothetical protein R2865_08760 [Deinococcales bacterium]
MLYSKAENKLLLNYLAELNDRRKLISVAGWRQENRRGGGVEGALGDCGGAWKWGM